MIAKGAPIADPKGKLGVLLVGMGAVTTTFIAGVEAIRKGFAQPIGSLTQMGTIRLGKRTDGRSPLIKMIAFKSERESNAWTALLGSDTFPTGIRTSIEALHLDTRSIAALYAMQRIISEAESGALNATPSQVMSVLARELDFFWKRVTRPVA